LQTSTGNLPSNQTNCSSAESVGKQESHQLLPFTQYSSHQQPARIADLLIEQNRPTTLYELQKQPPVISHIK
ncbi:unnamed protein product, partial [Ilex paraguariensis]